MASILIRRLDETTKAKLRARASGHGRSMETEAREIIKGAVSVKSAKRLNLAEAIRRHVEALGGFDLVSSPREALPAPVDFNG